MQLLRIPLDKEALAEAAREASISVHAIY